MRPLQPQHNTSEERQAFTEAAEEWLLRPRNPHADEAVLDAVQRRQERQDDEQHAHTTPTSSDTQAIPSSAIISAARLVKLRGQQQCAAWLLPFDRPALIGRSGKTTSSLDIDLSPDMTVSRRHALIWFDGEGWCIEDLRSTNGTVLANGNIHGQRAIRLAIGTKIRFGRTILMLTGLEPEVVESAKDGADVPSAS